nr:hypothetical protein [Paraburkholderia sp. J12]
MAPEACVFAPIATPLTELAFASVPSEIVSVALADALVPSASDP